ncbi:hypothetical protein F4776DRAFT_631186 [Hypoxylon sp. NC0597]|nr:hypothetical protein F4776DRAFT_631186 [Hypoxylon sp. NC0597]
MSGGYPMASSPTPPDTFPAGSSAPNAIDMGREIWGEAEELKMARRARAATIKLVHNSATLISRLHDFIDEIHQSQEKMDTFIEHTGYVLQWAERDGPKPYLQRFGELLSRAEQISTSFLSHVDVLDSFFQEDSPWITLSNQFDRLCLPLNFWETNAITALHHIPTLACGFPILLYEIIVVYLEGNEAYAEHFCRLSVNGRARFITFWIEQSTDWELDLIEEYLGFLFKTRAFEHLPDYDQRPVSLWVEEESFTIREDTIEQGSRYASRAPSGEALQRGSPVAT